MKELKFVKTFEQFSHTDDEINEGRIGDALKKGAEKIKSTFSTKESMIAALKDNPDNLAALIKKINGGFQSSFNPLIKKAIANLDLKGAKRVLELAIGIYEKDNPNFVHLAIKNGILHPYGKNGSKARNL